MLEIKLLTVTKKEIYLNREEFGKEGIVVRLGEGVSLEPGDEMKITFEVKKNKKSYHPNEENAPVDFDTHKCDECIVKDCHSILRPKNS